MDGSPAGAGRLPLDLGAFVRDPLDDREVEERFADLVAHWDDTPAGSPDAPSALGTPAAPSIQSTSGTQPATGTSAATTDPAPPEARRPDSSHPDAPRPDPSHPDPAQPGTSEHRERLPDQASGQSGPSSNTASTPETVGEGPTDEEPADPVETDPLARLDPQWRMPTSERTFDELLDAEEELGFTPDPVELPPPEDLHYWAALIGLVSGPILVLYVVFGDPVHRGWWLLGGLGLTVAGFVLLVMRMPAHRDPEDDDDGARV